MRDAPNDSSHCAVCGAEVATEEWHPAAIDESRDGVRIRTFCTDTCRNEWETTGARVAADD